jgi:HPt (histidine-containing phosphotransfer) domain-containing protein
VTFVFVRWIVFDPYFLVNLIGKMRTFILELDQTFMKVKTHLVNKIFDESISFLSQLDPGSSEKFINEITEDKYLESSIFSHLSQFLCLYTSQKLGDLKHLTLGMFDNNEAQVIIDFNTDLAVADFEEIPQILAKFSLSKSVIFTHNANYISLQFPIIAADETNEQIELNLLPDYFPDYDTAELIINQYFKDLNNKLQAVEDNLKKEEIKEAHRLSHSLKGGAFTICANKLGKFLKSLEQDLKQIVQNNAKIGYNEINLKLSQVNEEAKNCLEYWNQLDLNIVKEHFNGNT